MATVSILDYGAGNLTSVRLAFQRLGVTPVLCEDAAAVAHEGPVVFPGVGSAGSGMAALSQRGFDGVLRQALADERPVLGICLGMQLLFQHSAEDGGVEALGIIPGQVRLFEFPPEQRMKVPEMGWNGVEWQVPQGSLAARISAGIPQGTPFYFVHSYYCCPSEGHGVGTTEYGALHFTSAAAKGTLFATQFHPERSGEAGMALLRNFIKECC